MKYPERYTSNDSGNDRETDAEQNRRLAVSLEGEDLETWLVHVETLEETEGFLSAAIKTNDSAVAIATPVSYLFKALAAPLWLLTYSTSGIVHLFFRILLTPIFGVVLLTSSIWTNSPKARLLLMVVGPLFVVISLWLLYLFPEKAEIRDAKISLCKVWPLSRRRLEWIKTHQVY